MWLRTRNARRTRLRGFFQYACPVGQWVRQLQCVVACDGLRDDERYPFAIEPMHVSVASPHIAATHAVPHDVHATRIPSGSSSSVAQSSIHAPRTRRRACVNARRRLQAPACGRSVQLGCRLEASRSSAREVCSSRVVRSACGLRPTSSVYSRGAMPGGADCIRRARRASMPPA